MLGVFTSKSFTSTFIKTFLARGVTAFGGVCLGILLGRFYGPSGLGVFSLALSLTTGASVIAKYGLDTALVSFVGRDPASYLSAHYLIWAMTRVFLVSVLLACGMFFLGGVFATAFSTENLDNMLYGFSFSLPAFTLCFILSGLMKGLQKPVIACLLEGGGVSLLSSIVIFFAERQIEDFELTHVGWAFFAASMFVFSVGFILSYFFLKGQGGKIIKKMDSESEFLKFKSSSSSFFISSISGLIQSVVSVLIAGFFLDPMSLGYFKSSERIGLVISFVLMVLNTILPPKFALLYRNKEYGALEALARRGVVIGLCLSFPISMLCIIFPEFFLNLFGEEFSNGAILLQIIAIGQLVNVATGSSVYMLNMSGNEVLMRNISLISSGIGLFLFLGLVPLFGAVGAAVGLSFLLIFQNIVAMYFVKKKLNISMLPFMIYL